MVFVAGATSAVPRATAAALKQEEQAALVRSSLVKLQEEHQRLELVQREREALLETIVHDMRSPVGAALLSVEYLAIELRKDAKNQTMIEATDDALGTLNSLSRMISQILDMSKLESGRLTLRFDLAEVRSVLETSIAEAASRAKARFQSLDLQAPEDLKAALDMRLFPRALDALLTYTIRHTPEHGRILVVASQGPSETRVSIHSTSPALPESERSRLFDRFLPTGVEPRRPPSAGVALYFCRLVAEAHQGSITLENVDGWPTSIVIHLPLAN
jgi:K+-sensing histidine kinase KdpD